MKNIIGFIRQNFTFFSFLILQIVSLVMLSSYSKSHQTFFGGIANQFIGDINTRYNNASYFFSLKTTNAKLSAENAMLRNQLAQNFIPFDTSKKLGTLVLRKDSLEKIRKLYGRWNMRASLFLSRIPWSKRCAVYVIQCLGIIQIQMMR